MSYTPGPWIVYQPESIHICYEGEDNPATIRAGGTHVATIPGMRPHLTGNRLATSHLIRARSASRAGTSRASNGRRRRSGLRSRHHRQGERVVMIPIEILSEMVRLHDLGIRPQVVRGMWREEKEWEFAIEQARQRLREWNNLNEELKSYE